MTDGTNQGPVMPGDGNQMPPPPVPPVPPTPPTPTQPSGYAQSYPGSPMGQQKTDGFAIASLSTGIPGILCICCWPLAILLGVLSTVFGFVSISKINKSNGMFKGKGMAIAGIILGIAAVVLAIFAVIFGFFVDMVNWEDFLNEIENQQ